MRPSRCTDCFGRSLHVNFKESFLLQAARSHARQAQQLVLGQLLFQMLCLTRVTAGGLNVQDLQAEVHTLQVVYLQHSTPHNCESGMYGVSCMC